MMYAAIARSPQRVDAVKAFEAFGAAATDLTESLFAPGRGFEGVVYG